MFCNSYIYSYNFHSWAREWEWDWNWANEDDDDDGSGRKAKFINVVMKKFIMLKSGRVERSGSDGNVELVMDLFELRQVNDVA